MPNIIIKIKIDVTIEIKLFYCYYIRYALTTIDLKGDQQKTNGSSKTKFVLLLDTALCGSAAIEFYHGFNQLIVSIIAPSVLTESESYLSILH